jgi:hypothetical protein
VSEQQRCENCLLYDPPADEPGMHHPDGACLFRLNEALPFWVYEFAMNAVNPDDGAFCGAWKNRP